MNTTETEGEVKHLTLSDYTPMPEPSDSLVNMWRDLYREMKCNPCVDMQNCDKYQLYIALTKKLHAQIDCLGFSTIETIDK